MKKVINNIKKIHYKNPVYVIYYNSVHRDLFINDIDFKLIDIDKKRKTDIYQYNQ